jgi:hypothetical protein
MALDAVHGYAVRGSGPDDGQRRLPTGDIGWQGQSAVLVRMVREDSDGV